MALPSWPSTPWEPVRAASSITGWCKKNVPYVADATYLQTLDIWLPAGAAPDAAASLSEYTTGPWLVYIHGGAWRDPFVSSSSFEVTAEKLLQSMYADEKSPRFAGLASLNYNLSAHPTHPTKPSPARDEKTGELVDDAARMSKHPGHIRDVLTALAYLQSLGGAHEYILTGHSCGATLAFEVAMASSRWGWDGPSVLKPKAIVGLNGLYDLPVFLDGPDESHKALLPVYDAFTRGAFGDERDTWVAVCPSVVEDWGAEWPEGRLVVLVQSREDSLVPYSQLELMRGKLNEPTSSGIKVVEMPVTGDHNDLWKKGDELADIFPKVVQLL